MKTVFNLSDFHHKTYILASIAASAIIEAIRYVVGKYLWNDWQYVGFLVTLIIIDTILGMLASKIGRGEPITSTKMTGMILKVIIYFCYLVAVNVAMNFTVDGAKLNLFEFLKVALYTSPILRELKSIDENLLTLGYSIFPKSLRDKVDELLTKK